MGTVDLSKMWLHLADLEGELERKLTTEPKVIPHEETDLHRVFCDEKFCLERGAITREQPILAAVIADE